MDTYPALLGVGYIIGPRIAGQMIAGGILAWLVMIPMIGFFFGSAGARPVAPATAAIPALDAWGIWAQYIRYIGAGAVATGGLITLVKTLPLLVSSVGQTFSGLKRGGGVPSSAERTNRDMPSWVLLGGVVLLILIIAFSPLTDVGIIGGIAVAVLGFFVRHRRLPYCRVSGKLFLACFRYDYRYAFDRYTGV